ncbi:MAG TPA: glycosyltransferase family 87 protein [Terriglobales bacterium]|nr:glycosyltransferase family 87 protein [Terriglobales bacterium]
MRARSAIGVVVALILAGSMWFYVDHILVPYQRADAVRHGRPRGNLSDLYPRWLGAREFLLHHRDPYSPEITREIQMGYYGRPLDSVRPDDPRDQQAFAYPIYVVYLLAPFTRYRFEAVQAVFRWVLLSLTLASVFWWKRAQAWRPGGKTLLILSMLVLGSYPAVQGIKLQQLSLLVSAIIAAGVATLGAGSLFVSGALLALATIKPQIALPLAGWLTMWSLSDLKSRRNFLGGFYLTLGALITASEYQLPGWIGRFREAVAGYRQYTDSRSLLDVLLTPTVGKVAAVALILLVVFVCWQRRRAAASSDEFALCTALVLAATVVVIPTFAPYNQLLLLPAILLILRFRERWWQKTASRIVFIIAGGLIVWPWLAALALTLASFFVPPSAVQQAWAVPLFTSLGIPLGVLAVLAFLLRDEPRLHFPSPGR